MDLWQLHIFVKVVELQSFSRAAEACHLSQPTVSTHIKELEEHFGCRLIDRLGRGTAPTRAGDILLSFAKKLLALRDEAETSLSAFLGSPRGRLVIGGSTIPGGYLLPRILGEFVREYQEVSVSLLIGDTATMAAQVIDGEVELAMVGALTKDKRLLQEKILDDDIRLLAPAGHPLCAKEPVAWEDLAAAPFILREAGSGTRRSLEAILEAAGHGIDGLNVMAEMGGTKAVREAVKAGAGVSVLSTRAAEPDIASGVLRALAIEGLDLSRSFYLIRNRMRTESPLCKVFGDFVKQSLKA